MEPTTMPNQWITEHQTVDADNIADAHPIDGDIVHDVAETKMDPVLIHSHLALLQAIAVREVLPYNGETATWVEQQGNVHYYQAQSMTFYDLLSMAHQWYDQAHVEVEDVPALVEAHTRQYLRDVHGPDHTYDAFVDSRGLVIEDGTHPE